MFGKKKTSQSASGARGKVCLVHGRWVEGMCSDRCKAINDNSTAARYAEDPREAGGSAWT